MYKKLGIVALSSSLLFSAAPLVHGEGTVQTEKAPVNVMSDKAVAAQIVEKEKLIKRVKELFPKQFDDVRESSFELESGIRFEQNKDIPQYGLSYFKEINGKYEHASFHFAGDSLELVNYYFDTDNQKDALFPPQVSEEEAEKIAAAFIKKISPNYTYELDENEHTNYNMSQSLTEPITYDFQYEKIENGVPVQNQGIYITVLGNGALVQYHNSALFTKATYEKDTGLLSKEEAIAKLKDNLHVELRYQVQEVHPAKEANVVLTYVPSPSVQGIHATTGKILLNNELVSKLPKQKELKMVSKTELKTDPISKEEAVKKAEQLLKPEVEGVTLNIEGVMERKNPFGNQTVYAIEYMYTTGNSGFGSQVEIAKDTGDVVGFHGHDYLELEQSDNKSSVTANSALNKAVNYVKQYAPSYANELAYPDESTEPVYYWNENEYNFYFPRVKNGHIVERNGVQVAISNTGKLIRFNVEQTDIKNWPSLDKTVSKEQALADYKDKMDVELNYITQDQVESKKKTAYYKLVYATKSNQWYTGEYYDATNGKWMKENSEQRPQAPEGFKVEHPWAEKELNYMIEGGIITVDDPESFDPNRSITKGEALEVISRSIMDSYYFEHYEYEENTQQTFENISPDHPLYGIVETAVEHDLITVTGKTFPVDEKITREELAVWYANVLDLADVAEYDEIYKLDVKDKPAIEPKQIGDIALMNALKVITVNRDGYFNPDEEVTLAQLAVSNMRLAQKVKDLEVHY